ncbi:hypothetical protein [Fervidobacterium sp. 2310opik-2]|uniref:hypothetical protein n=1 Tax=Fervidobacterium sp. 2310opik-2 TaxID=1755815 RepID=UPI0013DEECD2|nr:hypothetical protein [Fervidobacterium sp. 2310opik-2]KAF2961610.1 hypothetical protein AS161_08670 [Fervidobacterium sp. 2310opik-2]
MIVEVNNLALYEHYSGFEKFRDNIFRCKVNLLAHLSKTFTDAKFVFYNALGEFGLIEDLEEVLEGFFHEFEVIYKEIDLDFNSSPVNNVPQIRMDGVVKKLDEAETIGLYRLPMASNLKCDYTNCFYLIENFLTEDMGENTLSYVVDVKPRNFAESNITSNLNTIAEKYVVLKLIRGEELCF